MKSIIAFLFIFLLVTCKQTSEPADKPQVMPHPQELIDIAVSYKKLALEHHIKFTKVTKVGFSNIEQGRVIGLCEYYEHERHILIDLRYWRKASEMTKKILMFHELTHCLCTRDHDFENGQKYMSPIVEDVLRKIGVIWGTQPGYFQDDCPKSIMHPVIIDDKCSEKYHDFYMKEMFNRCVAW